LQQLEEYLPTHFHVRPPTARQVHRADRVPEVLECAGPHSETSIESGAADAMEQSKLAVPACGTSSEAAELPNSQLPSAAAERGDDAALQAAWAAIGLAHEYNDPPDQEARDLADPRSRGRAEKKRAARLKAEWQRLERARAAAEADAQLPAADDQPMPDIAALSVAASDDATAAPVPPPHAVPPIVPPPPAVPPPAAVPPPQTELNEGGWQVEGAWARVADIAAKPTLNGTLVRLGRWHADRQRWAVRAGPWTDMVDASGRAAEPQWLVRPINLRVPDHEQTAAINAHVAIERAAETHRWVCIDGLQSQSELDNWSSSSRLDWSQLNGCVARLGAAHERDARAAWSAWSGRWAMTIRTVWELRGQGLSLPTRNLRALDAAEVAAAEVAAAAVRERAERLAAAMAAEREKAEIEDGMWGSPDQQYESYASMQRDSFWHSIPVDQFEDECEDRFGASSRAPARVPHEPLRVLSTATSVSVPSLHGPPTQVPVAPGVAQLKGELEAAQSRLAEAPADSALLKERNAAIHAYLSARTAAFAAVTAAADAVGMRIEFSDESDE